jgi:hypothetical protein
MRFGFVLLWVSVNKLSDAFANILLLLGFIELTKMMMGGGY